MFLCLQCILIYFEPVCFMCKYEDHTETLNVYMEWEYKPSDCCSGINPLRCKIFLL